MLAKRTNTLNEKKMNGLKNYVPSSFNPRFTRNKDGLLNLTAGSFLSSKPGGNKAIIVSQLSVVKEKTKKKKAAPLSFKHTEKFIPEIETEKPNTRCVKMRTKIVTVQQRIRRKKFWMNCRFKSPQPSRVKSRQIRDYKFRSKLLTPTLSTRRDNGFKSLSPKSPTLGKSP